MLKIRAGRGMVGWGLSSSRLVPQPSEGQERAVYSALAQSLSDLPGGEGRHAQTGPFAGLWIVRATEPQFPQAGKGVYLPLPGRRRGEP